jgi:hypothetical protein
VVKAYEGAGYGPVTLLVVTDLAGADYPADYQAARLHSGLYTAVVCETYADAYAAMMRAHTNGDWSPLSA